MTDDADIFDPAARDVSLTGRASVRLRPLSVGQFPKFLRAVRPIIHTIATLQKDQPEQAAAELMLLDLYVDHGENINQAVAIASGLELAEIEALPLDDMLRLAVAVWEINQDFFSQRVIPLLGQASNLARAANGGGSTR